MTSSEGRRVGSQEPSFALCPDWNETDGWLATELATGYGEVPDRWQEDVLNDWLAKSDDGTLLNITCGLMVPRQNGKNFLLEVRELYGLLILHENILHTSHEYQSAKSAFDRLARFFGSFPGDPRAPYKEINRNLKRFTRSAGQMIIELRGGNLIEFRTRTNEAARGNTTDLLVVDEAQQYTDPEDEALSAVNDAAPSGSPQTIYTGTPPKAGGSAQVFTRLHRIAHEDPPGRECWHEWGIEEVGDVTDRDRWYATNPALGVRIFEDTVAAKLVSSSPEGFARERLGFWPDTLKANPISEQLWSARAVDSGPGEGVYAYGVKFSPDGGTVALAGARRPESGPVFVELIWCGSTGGAIERLREWLMPRARKAACVAIDGISGAPTLFDALSEDGFPKKALVRPSGRQAIEATSRFYEAVRSGRMSHSRQLPLAASATGCVRRSIGRDGAWGFGSTPETDSTPIEAAAFAYWAAVTTKRDPSRRMRVL